MTITERQHQASGGEDQLVQVGGDQNVTPKTTRIGKSDRHLRRHKLYDAAKAVVDRIITPAGFVKLSDKYREYVGGEKYMHKDDYDFFEDILQGYFTPSERGNGVEDKGEVAPSEEEKFFEAVTQVKDYGLALEQEVEGNLFKQIPRIGRFRSLVLLFLHHPKIRGPYMQVHAKKMGFALPDFSNELSVTDFNGSENREDYLKRAHTLMSDKMAIATEQFKPNDVVNLGGLIHFEQNDQFGDEESAVKNFAGKGVKTFVDILATVLDQAEVDHKDFSEAIKEEFLQRDGIAFQLMRIHLSDFVHKIMYPTDLKYKLIKRLLKRRKYLSGTCPAILKAPTPSGGQTERPIAYEYAATIVNNIPQRLVPAIPT